MLITVKLDLPITPPYLGLFQQNLACWNAIGGPLDDKTSQSGEGIKGKYNILLKEGEIYQNICDRFTNSFRANARIQG